ncbi:hypothetical protein [Breznakia pachnodae]|uniref:XRE family transcriptional regulator n=1 Tax=Breznakia pachnodae TaxID=265178 RepID=A0ABU0DZV5_9FIRM|nr:hypothetical protein [Breznakia pachnodae]MDQ0359976.1 hypothetical protein [Breznakia pachnodae]
MNVKSRLSISEIEERDKYRQKFKSAPMWFKMSRIIKSHGVDLGSWYKFLGGQNTISLETIIKVNDLVEKEVKTMISELEEFIK